MIYFLTLTTLSETAPSESLSQGAAPAATAVAGRAQISPEGDLDRARAPETPRCPSHAFPAPTDAYAPRTCSTHPWPPCTAVRRVACCSWVDARRASVDVFGNPRKMRRVRPACPVFAPPDPRSAWCFLAPLQHSRKTSTFLLSPPKTDALSFALPQVRCTVQRRIKLMRQDRPAFSAGEGNPRCAMAGTNPPFPPTPRLTASAAVHGLVVAQVDNDCDRLHHQPRVRAMEHRRGCRARSLHVSVCAAR